MLPPAPRRPTESIADRFQQKRTRDAQPFCAHRAARSRRSCVRLATSPRETPPSGKNAAAKPEASKRQRSARAISADGAQADARPDYIRTTAKSEFVIRTFSPTFFAPALTRRSSLHLSRGCGIYQRARSERSTMNKQPVERGVVKQFTT